MAKVAGEWLKDGLGRTRTAGDKARGEERRETTDKHRGWRCAGGRKRRERCGDAAGGHGWISLSGRRGRV